MKLLGCVIAIVALFLAFVKPLAFSIRQGLDLQGGTHVVLEAEDTDIAQVNDDAMNRVITIMEKRVNALGLTEPIIQREGERRVIIELPGVNDPDAAIKTIGKTAFYKCAKLKTITIKTTKLTTKTVGKNAFKGVYKKATVKVPAKKLKAYKTLLVKKGLPKTAKVKK